MTESQIEDFFQDPRAYTLLRPWDWALLFAGKDIENRPNPLPLKFLGKLIAIHGGIQYDEEDAEAVNGILAGEDSKLLAPSSAHWPGSMIHGLVRFDRCFEYTIYVDAAQAGRASPAASPWACGPYCYVVAARVFLREPVRVTEGFHRGFWRLPPTAVHAIHEALP